MDPLIGRTAGAYRILRAFGEGGMATVYQAYQPAMDRYVAIKIPASHLTRDPSFRAGKSIRVNRPPAGVHAFGSRGFSEGEQPRQALANAHVRFGVVAILVALAGFANPGHFFRTSSAAPVSSPRAASPVSSTSPRASPVTSPSVPTATDATSPPVPTSTPDVRPVTETPVEHLLASVPVSPTATPVPSATATFQPSPTPVPPSATPLRTLRVRWS